MTREKFKSKKTKVLKSITIVLAVILTIGLVFGLVYARYGLASFGKFLGLFKQHNIDFEEIKETESDYINTQLGYDLETEDKDGLSGSKDLELKVSGAGFTYLLSNLVDDAETFENLQVNVSDDNNLRISVIGNVNVILEAFGESKELIESNIGEIPDQLPVYVVVDLGVGDSPSVIMELMAGSVKIPNKLLASINPYVDEGLNLLFENTMDVKLSDIFIEDGEIYLIGDFPTP